MGHVHNGAALGNSAPLIVLHACEVVKKSLPVVLVEEIHNALSGDSEIIYPNCYLGPNLPVLQGHSVVPGFSSCVGDRVRLPHPWAPLKAELGHAVLQKVEGPVRVVVEDERRVLPLTDILALLVPSFLDTVGYNAGGNVGLDGASREVARARSRVDSDLATGDTINRDIRIRSPVNKREVRQCLTGCKSGELNVPLVLPRLDMGQDSRGLVDMRVRVRCFVGFVLRV